jgi:hypothetical protein
MKASELIAHLENGGKIINKDDPTTYTKEQLEFCGDICEDILFHPENWSIVQEPKKIKAYAYWSRNRLEWRDRKDYMETEESFTRAPEFDIEREVK